MAALLRSARLLKFSPSGLLQITGTKRNGPPLGRLYSGAVSGRRAGVCSRQISPVCENASSHWWPYAAGCVRNYAVATEHRDEGSNALRSKQAQQFDWALSKLDNSVRRTGRITKTLLLRIFHDIIRTGYPSGNQALLLLRSCGSLLPEVPIKERTELTHRFWDKLQELGVQYDVSHYNALLKVYLQNEFKFSPTDFLAKMEAANVQPNRVTYQRLIAAYCHTGDVEGASTILGFMKSKDLPITEAVFSSLVTGHARAGDIESAKNILPVMKGAGIEPTPDTYVSLLVAYAEKGDVENLKTTLEAAESADCSLMDRDIMQVIAALAKAGHLQHIPQMVERLRHERGFIPDAMNLCLSLVTQGQEDTAFLILMAFPSLQLDNFSDPNLGNFFIRHCINMDTSLEKIARYCKVLQESNQHSAPLSFSLFCALEAKKMGTAVELMKLFKEQDLPLRPHYFWPLLIHYGKESNTAGVVEVMKNMQDLGIPLDVETLSNHVLPAFPSRTAARQALQDGGVSLESESFLISELRLLTASNLAEAYTLMSDPSFPPVDISFFRGSLISGFKRSTDVENMVKILELLHKDERFVRQGTKPSDSAGFFLYNLMDNMMEVQVQAQEDKLRSFFNQLYTQNIFIPLNLYRGIRNILSSYNTPELIKDVSALVDPADRTSTDPGTPPPPTAAGIEGKMSMLGNRLAELKAENKPVNSILKQMIQILSMEEDLQRALELKQEHQEDMTAAAYAILINLCCRHNNVDEALNLKRELNRMDSSITLDTSKYITLVKALAINDKVEDAVDILKEMKEKDVAMNDSHVTSIFHILNTVAAKGSIDSVRQLQDTIFTLGLVKPNANLCSPMISAYLASNDVSGALEAALECQKRYNHLPRIHDIIVALVERGDTDLLQKAMDFVSQERGEMIMLYDLFFAFLQTGRYREARKIVETPGLRSKPGRLQWFAEKCIATNQMEALEQMVEMTSKLFECDRDDMYSYILRLCKDTNDWQKAEALWMKMQEENVIPRERTLHLLADILRHSGKEVPFEVPETWYEQDDTTQQVKPAEEAAAAASGSGSAPASASAPAKFTPKKDGEYNHHLMALCKKGKVKEAFAMLKEVDKKGVALGPAPYDQIIRSLLAEGSSEDAMVVKEIAESRVPGFKLSDIANSMFIITYIKEDRVKDALEKLKSMLQADHLPSHLAITRLVQALGNHGDVAGIKQVESLIQSLGTRHNLSSMVFVNNSALAHIKNGDVESAVELLEGIYTSSDSPRTSMSYVFRKVLESGNEQALDKLSVMAERLANHFACYRPASDLFLQLLEMDKVEDAKFMLARCNAVAEQKDTMLSFMTKQAQIPGQVNKIKNLVDLIPDVVGKQTLYSYLMKCHALDKDLTSAKALHEQMQKEGIVADELSLKRLARLYRDAGEMAPFPEPPESFRFYANKLREKSAKE